MDQHSFDDGPDSDLDRHQNRNSDTDQKTGLKYMPGSPILSGHDEAYDQSDVKINVRKGVVLKSWQIWLSFSFVAVSRRRCR